MYSTLHYDKGANWLHVLHISQSVIRVWNIVEWWLTGKKLN